MRPTDPSKIRIIKQNKMAGIKDILEIEKERKTLEDWRKLHLFQEGSFYRAYEVSAWLCHKYIHPFKVTHRHVKGVDQSIAFVGFPVTSLEKRKPEGATIENIAEKHIAVNLSMEEGITTDVCQNDFAIWKSLQPLDTSKDNEEKKEGGKVIKGHDGSLTLFGVAQMLLAYPIESHSPIDCMLFLADVKKELARIV